MCRHDNDWAENRARRLVTAMGGAATASKLGTPRPVGDAAVDANRQATVSTQSFAGRNGSLEVNFFLWSPLTNAYKDSLIYDRLATDTPPGEVKLTRASLNRDLKKGLMNDCLVDAVVYSGPNGHPIRRAMRQAVCEALGGTIGAGGCEVPPGQSPPTLVFVSESLGSKMLFDAIVTIWNEARQRGGAAEIGVARALSATRMMFMVSNQVPLLDTAGLFPDTEAATKSALTGAGPRSAGRADTEKAALSVLSQARRLAGAPRSADPALDKFRAAPAPGAPPTTGPITLVAFSDPNDLLSYRMIPAHLGGDLGDFRFFNIAVSNDTTYFGLVERPDTAHCGYAWNAYVLGMLMHGRHGGQNLPTAPTLPGGSCRSNRSAALSVGGDAV